MFKLLNMWLVSRWERYRLGWWSSFITIIITLLLLFMLRFTQYLRNLILFVQGVDTLSWQISDVNNIFPRSCWIKTYMKMNYSSTVLVCQTSYIFQNNQWNGLMKMMKVNIYNILIYEMYFRVICHSLVRQCHGHRVLWVSYNSTFCFRPAEFLVPHLQYGQSSPVTNTL